MNKNTFWWISAFVVTLGELAFLAYLFAPTHDKQTAAEMSRVSVNGQVKVGSGNVPGPVGAPARLGASRVRGEQFGTWGSKPPTLQYESGEILVADPPQNFLPKVRGAGYSMVENIRLTNLGGDIYRMKIPPGSTISREQRALANLFPGVLIDVNHHFQGQASAAFAAPANSPRAMAGWDRGSATCGTGIRIGMIDSAIDQSHPALRDSDVEFRSFHGQGQQPGSASHGTAVAAMLVGSPEWGGLLSGATLKAANIFERDAASRIFSVASGVAKAMDWLAGQRLHVVNFGIAGADNKVVRQIVDKAYRKNVVMVAAAGNWNTDQYPAYPAAYDGVIAVTAFGYGGALLPDASFGSYIDFAAPGANILSASPGGGKQLWSGTSFASPFIAVLSALEVARRKDSDTLTLRAVLSQSSVDLGTKGWDPRYGWGYINQQPAC